MQEPLDNRSTGKETDRDAPGGNQPRVTSSKQVDEAPVLNVALTSSEKPYDICNQAERDSLRVHYARLIYLPLEGDEVISHRDCSKRHDSKREMPLRETEVTWALALLRITETADDRGFTVTWHFNGKAKGTFVYSHDELKQLEKVAAQLGPEMAEFNKNIHALSNDDLSDQFCDHMRKFIPLERTKMTPSKYAIEAPLTVLSQELCRRFQSLYYFASFDENGLLIDSLKEMSQFIRNPVTRWAMSGIYSLLSKVPPEVMRSYFNKQLNAWNSDPSVRAVIGAGILLAAKKRNIDIPLLGR